MALRVRAMLEHSACQSTTIHYINIISTTLFSIARYDILVFYSINSVSTAALDCTEHKYSSTEVWILRLNLRRLRENR